VDSKLQIPELVGKRSEIDGIDKEIVKLFCRRMQISEEVAGIKKAHNAPVFDAAREKELLASVRQAAGETFGTYARSLYETILSLSRSYQHKMQNGPGRTEEMILESLGKTSQLFPENASVACQGVPGAYSQHAAERLFEEPDITFFDTFEEVYEAVENGTCRYGVLPLENSTYGSVRDVYDLMIRKTGDPLYIVRALRLKIDHSLLIKKGSDISRITKILSHEQALAQSAAFLKNTFPHAIIEKCANTAVAAMEAARSDGTVAALASADCAGQYGLTVAMSDVQDNKNNYTRFICISKELEIYPGAVKSSMVITTEHKPGSLSRVLNRINAWGINMSKLESRPIPGHDFEFMFYFDIECPVYSPRLGPFFTEMEQNTPSFRYLGTYSEML